MVRPCVPISLLWFLAARGALGSCSSEAGECEAADDFSTLQLKPQQQQDPTLGAGSFNFLNRPGYIVFQSNAVCSGSKVGGTVKYPSSLVKKQADLEELCQAVCDKLQTCNFASLDVKKRSCTFHKACKTKTKSKAVVRKKFFPGCSGVGCFPKPTSNYFEIDRSNEFCFQVMDVGSYIGRARSEDELIDRCKDDCDNNNDCTQFTYSTNHKVCLFHAACSLRISNDPTADWVTMQKL